jgi:tetratricopeptide (TPR) repeat protein
MEDGLAEAFLPEAGYVSSVGQAHEIAGSRESSLWLYENHALQVPWDSSARNNWAYSLAEAERELPLALAMIRRAAQERSEPLASFLDTEAWVLHKLGRDDEALEVMERAILHATDSRYQTPEGRVEMMYHRGVILEAIGQIEEARNVLRGCVARGHNLPFGAHCRRALEAL